MDKEQLLDSYTKEQLEAIINMNGSLGDRDVPVSANNVQLTMKDIKDRLSELNRGIQGTKEYILASYTPENLRANINNYSYLNDEDVAMTINNVGITLGDFKKELDRVNRLTPGTKEYLLESYTEEQLQAIVDNYTSLKDEDVAMTIQNISVTAGEYRDELLSRNPDAVIKRPSSITAEEPTVTEPTPEPVQEEPDQTQEETKDEPKESSYKNMSEEEINARLNQLWNSGISSGEFEDDDKEVIEYHDLLAELNRRKKENPYKNMSEEEINARLNQLWNSGIASGEFEEDDKEVIEYHDLLAELNRRKKEQEKEFNPFEKMSEEDINRRLGELWRESISSGELEDDDPAVKEYHDLLAELNRRRKAEEEAKAAEESKTETAEETKDEEEKLEWDPRLTQEQIDDAKSRGIYEPKGDEYEQFLREHGLDINKKEAPVEKTPEEHEEEKTEEEPEKEEPSVEVPAEKKKFDKEKAKALLKKGLWFAGGFAAGLGMSCVPGVGVIRTGLAAVKTVQFTSKLVNKGINAWTNKHPDGKVANVVNKINNSKAGQFVERTSTNIGNAWNNSAIGRGVNNIKAKLKSTPIKYAVNGVALGYLTGNMVELFTGKTVLQNITDKFHHEPQIIEENTQGFINGAKQEVVDTPTQSTQAYSDYGLSSANIPVQSTATVPDVPTVPEVPTSTVVEQAIKSGQTVDISSLHYGGVSSVSNPIALNTAAGQHVLFDQAVVLKNGQEMWHMAQADAAGNLIGKGYAWFPKEEVIEAVQGLSQTGITR